MRSPTQSNRPKALTPRLHADSGFGVVELVIVVAVISIVSAVAFIGVSRARDSLRLQSSMRQLASRVEMARLDAIRRHKSATVEFTGADAYTIKMDFGGTGVETTRSYSLEPGVTINSPSTDLPVFDFDWRGRTPQCFTSITMQSSSSGGGSSTLSVSSAGDITVDARVGSNLTTTGYSTVSATGDVQKGAIVSGSSPPPCLDPCGTCVPEDLPYDSTPPAGCSVFRLNKTFLSIRKNGRSTDSFTVSATTAADTISVAQTDGRANLEFLTAATQAIGANASKTFTVRSKNNSTGLFPIKFTSACNQSNSVSATVRVNP